MKLRLVQCYATASYEIPFIKFYYEKSNIYNIAYVTTDSPCGRGARNFLFLRRIKLRKLVLVSDFARFKSLDSRAFDTYAKTC